MMKNLIFNTADKLIRLIILFLSIGLSVSAAYSSDFSNNLDRAAQFLETGKPDSAAVLLYDIVDNAGDKNERVRAYYYLSQAMGSLGYLGEEIQYLIMAREESSSTEYSERVNIAYARILLDTGNYEDCIGITEEFISSNKNSPLLPEMMYISGNANFMKNEYRRAFGIFKEINERFPENERAADSVLKQGICLYKLDLTGGAIEKFEYYITKYPSADISDALYYLGLCYETSKQTEQASETFAKLLKEYSGYPKILDVYYHYGKNCFETGKYSEAANAFKNYTLNSDRNDPRYNDALLYLERISYRKGQYENEIDIFETFVQKYPDNPLSGKMLFDLARYYKTSGDMEKAVEKYRTLMTNRNFSAFADSAAFLYGDLMYPLERSQEAAFYINKIAREKNDSQLSQKLIFRIGTLFEKWEDYDNAVSWYDSTFEIGASQDLNILSLMGIARIFRKMDRWVESSKTYERIIREYPENPYIKSVYLALSEDYLLQGKAREAANNAEKALKYSGPKEKTEILLQVAQIYEDIDEAHALSIYSMIYNNTRNTRKQIAEALLNYGNLSLKLGDRDSAAKAYASIINSGSDSLTVRKAREKLAIIRDRTN